MNPFSRLPVYDLPSGSARLISGSPEHKFWIILQSQEASDPELQDFLHKILLAIQLDPANDTGLFSLEQNKDISLVKLLENHTGGKTILSFGPKPLNFGMSIAYRPYHLFNLHGNTFLFSDSLKTIQSDSNRKRELWDSLQQIKTKP